jgi:hypothetical protein
MIYLALSIALYLLARQFAATQAPESVRVRNQTTHHRRKPHQ